MMSVLDQNSTIISEKDLLVVEKAQAMPDPALRSSVIKIYKGTSPDREPTESDVYRSIVSWKRLSSRIRIFQR
jgi:hypothetical protein